MLAPKSNPLLAVEELQFAKQGSMNSGEFHAHVVKIAKRCKFHCTKALLAVEELHFTKQGSVTSGEFHSHIVKIAKRCQFPNPEAEERAIRDAIFLGMNSQRARDKAINLMNEEGKELTVEFLMNQLAVEDCNAHHKSLSQLNSTSSVNFAAYDHRQNKGKSNKSK